MSNIIGKSNRVFSRHKGGKIEMNSRVPIESQEELRDEELERLTGQPGDQRSAAFPSMTG